MSFTSAVMKDITHYFRPSSINDRQADGSEDCSKSNLNIEGIEELKNDECKLYLSESDDGSDFVTPKKKPHLIVQVPGISVSKDSARKRKCKEEITLRVKKIKTIQCETPVLRRRECNSENVKMEESYYMSPLRLDSDSSSEGSPTSKQASVNSLSDVNSDASPVYRTSKKRKGSLRIAKNPFLNSWKSKTEIPVDSPKVANKSPLGQRTPTRGKNESSREKEASGSLHKYFENVSAVKSRSCSASPEGECISSPQDKLSDVVIISPGCDSVKGDAKLKTSMTQLRVSPRKKQITALNNPVMVSQQVKSVAKSPAKSKKSKNSVEGEQEAGTSSASKDKKGRSWASPKKVAECLKNSTSNNILNYFDRAEIPKKSKRRKAKNRKMGTEEKVKPKVALDVQKSNAGQVVVDIKECNAGHSANNSSSDVKDIPGPLEIGTIMTRRRSSSRHSLKRVPWNDSAAPPVVLVKDDDSCTRPLSEDVSDKSESFENGAIKYTRRRRSSQRNASMPPKEVVPPSVTPKIQRPTTTAMEKSNNKQLRTKQNEKKPSLHLKSSEVAVKKATETKVTVKNMAKTKVAANNVAVKKVAESKVAVGKSSKESPSSVTKKISPVQAKQRSANQCRAAAIVKRACRQPQVKQQIRRIRDPRIPCTSLTDDVIILSEKTSSGATKEIVIRPSFVKLAPLFVAKEELQRKKCFLQSGAPEIVLRRMKQQKRMEVELEEASDFPSVSHTQQKETKFPWCLETNPKLVQPFSLGHTEHLGEQKEMLSILSRKLCLGDISSLPSSLAAMLIHLRPPLPNLASPDGSPAMSPEALDSADCFCEAMSPDISMDETSQVYGPWEVEMFERVHAWLMRSLLPPGLAYKMCVDLSFFLPPSSSAGFENDHIVVVPRDSSGPSLRKEMLLKLKEDYPAYPVNRKYKDFYLRKKSDGGLYAYTIPPTQEVISLDASPPTSGNDKNSAKDGSSDSKNLKTPSKLRRSVRRVSLSHSTPMPAAKVKDVTEQKSDSGANSLLSINDTAVKAPCSSLLTSESWTDIFAPTSFIDACSLGRNLKTLDKLRNWLESWATKGTSKGTKKDKKGDESWSDSEEESSSDNEFSCSGKDDVKKDNKNLPTNVAILIGPCGSGKTSSVYALAKELNYKVLEINASSKRSGKYILATVKEATRSYQVMSSGGQNSPASIGSFFKKNTPNKLAASAQKKTPKKSPKPSEKASSAMSLIFVEDVDVIFENEDEGFIGALTSLTTSTKRPVILEVHTSKPLRMGTTNNWLLEETVTEACPHLINFLARQNRTPLILPFERNSSNLHAEALLRVACLTEGVWVSKQWSECVVKQTAGDFRRAIQEAQFWAGSVARSSIMLDNLSRYPKELTQKGDYIDEKSVALLAQKLAPVNLCGCLGRRACSYPYSWMHKDYIQCIWLKLDRIVDTALVLMQDVVSSGTGEDERASCLSPSAGQTLKPVAKEENILKEESSAASPKKEMSSDMASIKKNLLSSFNGVIKTENASPPVRHSSRVNKGNRRINLTVSHRRSLCKTNTPSALMDIRHAKEPKVIKKEEEIIKKEKVTDDGSEKLNSLLSREKCYQESRRKMDLLAFSDYLDVLCTSDVFLKKFQTAGSQEMGKSLVFEIGSVSRLTSLSMQVSSSEKSREMEAKQAKDSYTAAQYQMILPIMPNHWLLNCPALALDVAPHIRETCRILDELTQTGKTRTRLSHRLPTINRVGPTLREALCRTLVDNFNIPAPPVLPIDSTKEEEKSEK